MHLPIPLALAFLCPPQGPDAPLIAVAGSAFHDFGDRLEGELLLHEFHLDVGPSAIWLDGFTATCGAVGGLCARGPEDTRAVPVDVGARIEAGARVVVPLTMGSTRNRSGRRVGLRLDVRSEEGRSVSLWVRATARIEPLIVPDLVSQRIERRHDDAPCTGSVTFRTSTGERIRLRLADRRPGPGRKASRAVPDGVRVELVPLDADPFGLASSWRADVHLVDPRAARQIQVPIDVASDVLVRDGDRATHTGHASVQFEIVGPVSLAESFVSFGLMRAGATAEARRRTVSMTLHDDALDPAALEVSLEPDGATMTPWLDAVEATVVPGNAPGTAEILLTLPELTAAMEGVLRGQVRIDMPDPGDPPLRLRFSGVVRR